MMTDKKQALEALLAKVEAGEWDELKDEADGTILDDWVFVFDDAYNGSLDAAKALHEAVLAGYHRDAFQGKSSCRVTLQAYTYDKIRDCMAYGDKFEVRGTNEARAWLIAIIKALISQEADAS